MKLHSVNIIKVLNNTMHSWGLANGRWSFSFFSDTSNINQTLIAHLCHYIQMLYWLKLFRICRQCWYPETNAKHYGLISTNYPTMKQGQVTMEIYANCLWPVWNNRIITIKSQASYFTLTNDIIGRLNCNNTKTDFSCMNCMNNNVTVLDTSYRNSSSFCQYN